MSPIPWITIIKHAPLVVATAKRLFETADANEAQARKQGVNTRLESLETGSVETARVLQDVAQQVEALTRAQEQTARRARHSIALGVAAVIIAVAAAVLALIR